MAFNFFAAGVLAIVAEKINGREGKLPIDMEIVLPSKRW
jgi:hypothetical protein